MNNIQVEHDATGNLTRDSKNRVYEYDGFGRLAKITGNEQSIASYSYNALNQRVRKETSQEITTYVYDLQGQLLQESTRNKQRTATQSSTISYVWLGNQPVAQITASETSENTTYITSDHLNTPRAAYDQEKTQVWQWNSDAFGAEQPSGNAAINLRFLGQYFDHETGLHYNWHRYYNPETGRYITSDPIGLKGWD